jgi:hypothetical protein
LSVRIRAQATIQAGHPRGRVERAAWLDSALPAFFMAKGFVNLGSFDQMGLLTRCWSRIVELAERASPGDGFLVSMRGGKIQRL